MERLIRGSWAASTNRSRKQTCRYQLQQQWHSIKKRICGGAGLQRKQEDKQVKAPLIEQPLYDLQCGCRDESLRTCYSYYNCFCSHHFLLFLLFIIVNNWYNFRIILNNSFYTFYRSIAVFVIADMHLFVHVCVPLSLPLYTYSIPSIIAIHVSLQWPQGCGRSVSLALLSNLMVEDFTTFLSPMWASQSGLHLKSHVSVWC